MHVAQDQEAEQARTPRFEPRNSNSHKAWPKTSRPAKFSPAAAACAHALHRERAPIARSRAHGSGSSFVRAAVAADRFRFVSRGVCFSEKMSASQRRGHDASAPPTDRLRYTAARHFSASWPGRRQQPGPGRQRRPVWRPGPGQRRAWPGRRASCRRPGCGSGTSWHPQQT